MFIFFKFLYKKRCKIYYFIKISQQTKYNEKVKWEWKDCLINIFFLDVEIVGKDIRKETH